MDSLELSAALDTARAETAYWRGVAELHEETIAGLRGENARDRVAHECVAKLLGAARTDLEAARAQLTEAVQLLREFCGVVFNGEFLRARTTASDWLTVNAPTTEAEGGPDIPVPRDTHTCMRCKWTCPHVEASGIWFCPNCGPAVPIPGDPEHCTYAGSLGCKHCGASPTEAEGGTPAGRKP